MDEINDPTPDEIRLACWEIQAGWTLHERHKRSGCFIEAETVNVPLALDLGDSIEFIDSAGID